MLDQVNFLTLFWLFTMSKKLTCCKKYPFHCAHTKLFTLNFTFSLTAVVQIQYTFYYFCGNKKYP